MNLHLILFLLIVIFYSCDNKSAKKSHLKFNISLSEAKENNDRVKKFNAKNQNKDSIVQDPNFDHISLIRKNSIIRQSSETSNHAKYLVDYIIENKLDKPEYIKFIKERNLLRELHIEYCDSNNIFIKDILTNDKTCEIEIKASKFDEEQHEIIFTSSDDYYKDYKKIDGKIPYGAFYGKSKHEVTSVSININDSLNVTNSISLPSLNNTLFCERNGKENGVKAYEDNDYIYIYVSGGNAANYYFGKLVFKHNKYITSIIVDYVPISIYGSFGPHFIGF